MIRKRLLSVLFLLMMISSLMAENREHLVKPGDTLYSLAKRYGVTVEAIQAANPSIEGTNIPAGMTLIIPGEEGVNEKDGKKKAIVFNFGKKKDKDKDKDKKKDGKEPAKNEKEETPVKQDQTEKPKQDDVQVATSGRIKPFGAPDNVVVILPFNLDAQTSTDDKQQMRSVEFYEGFLLAVNEAQERGQRILVQTYDLGTKSMGEILGTKSLLDADMIIAPMELAEVKQIADFGKENDINVVSPFVFDASMSKTNKNLIQLNTSFKSSNILYENLTNDVVERFQDYDYVFISDENFSSKKDPYVAYLKKELKAKNIKYHEFPYTNPEKLVAVDSLLNIVDHNILYIQEANHKDALRRMFPCLKCTTFEGENEQPRRGQTAILGFPEWVLYSSDFLDYYYDMNVYFFSKFYINPLDEKVKNFSTNFRYWYAKEPMPLTPRYAMLGYDIGTYFLTAIRRHGTHFETNLDVFSTETLQSMLSFTRDGEGLINKGLYMIHFTPSTQIEKYEIK